MKNTMQAVVLTGVTPAEQIKLSTCPIPQVRPGWVLVKIKAFGLNHSEQLLRLQEIQYDYITKPIIPGIECVGEIAAVSDSSFTPGQRVVALMGGMGRSFHGSYAEYALLPVHHVFALHSGMTWAQAAAVPETYFTAWGSLFEGLQLQSNDTLLIRGATCALGYAALQIAKAMGCRVIATTHKQEKLELLKQADVAIVDDGCLAPQLSGVTKALELVGPRTLRDTLRCLRRGGLVCSTGILGGVYALNGFDPIKDIPNGVYLTGFFSNYPTQEIMDAIFGFFAKYRLQPLQGPVYDFADIKAACQAQDSGSHTGKIIVTI